MPVWNTPPLFLAKSIESCLQQTFQDFELIIVNDQSSEEVTKILEQFNVVPCIKVLNTPTRLGLVASLNYGIEQAQGEYIARMDSDDIMMNNRLELQVKTLDNDSQLNLCAGDAVIINEKEQMIGSQLLSCDDLSQLNKHCCIIHSSVMWRKSYFDEYNLKYRREYDEGSEDYDLWFQFRNSVSPTYQRIKTTLVNYRLWANNKYKSAKKGINLQLFKEYNIQPYISVLYIGEKDKEDYILKSLKDGSIENYEIINNVQNAKGKYVAFVKYSNTYNRLNTQSQFLDDHLNFVGIGSFIKTAKGQFFYTSEPHLIESELLKGHIVIEPGTFMVRTEAMKAICNENDVQDDFKMFCKLLKYGRLGNYPQPLVECDNYKAIHHKDIVNRILYAKEAYKDIINIVQLNITSDGNISGVDRYLKTLEDNYPPNVRCTRITFIVSNRMEWKVDHQHSYIYYNAKTKLESMYDMFWDNLGELFMNKHNLIVQSNCLNLYSLITYIRQKVNCKHICAMHCVPYREVIRYDRKKYKELNELYADTDKDFIETPAHIAALSLADHVILNTKDAEQYFNRVGFLTPYSVIYNGIESIGKGNPEEKFRFIFVGHSSPLKGLDQLLPIIETLKDHHTFEVVWVGNADQKLTDIIKQKKLPIQIMGVISPTTLNELYKTCHAALIASACETCCYAAIEALSAGLPIIAPLSPGVTEIVDGAGLLVDIDSSGMINKSQYRDAMEKVMTDSNLRDELSAKSLAKAPTYSIDRLIDDSVKLYQRLLNGH